jgi:predicted aldo/keto reductase-like oxidoreductase
LSWLDDEVGSLVEAAYRYAASQEGVTSVICGTIEAKDLEENSRTILKGPLSQAKQDRLQRIFGRVAEAIGN